MTHSLANSTVDQLPAYPNSRRTQAQMNQTPFFGKNGFDFGDFLDIINPLEHLPIISNIYNKITGTTASAGAKVIGGALFGGPVGLASSVLAETFNHASEGSTTALASAKTTAREVEVAYDYPTSRHNPRNNFAKNSGTSLLA